MNFITHACLPVVLTATYEIIRYKRNNKSEILNTNQLLLIGVAGMLPDLLWPHFSLQQRLNSWTHTIWFLFLLFPIVYLLARWRIKRIAVKFSILFWMAAALHIAVDGISGGVNPLYPIVTKIGIYFIHYKTWLFYDLIFVSLAIILLIKTKQLSKLHQQQ